MQKVYIFFYSFGLITTLSMLFFKQITFFEYIND